MSWSSQNLVTVVIQGIYDFEERWRLTISCDEREGDSITSDGAIDFGRAEGKLVVCTNRNGPVNSQGWSNASESGKT